MSRRTQVTPPAPTERDRRGLLPILSAARQRAEEAGTQPGSVRRERARFPKWVRAGRGGGGGLQSAAGRPGGAGP